jgi:hypothetical protein
VNLNRNRHYRSRRFAPGLIATILIILIFLGGYLIYRGYRSNTLRMARVITWLRDPFSHPELMVQAGERCGDAPFAIPTDGFIGYLWDDSFRIGHHHQGIDIFSGTPGEITPVVAAYPGYLTRMSDWKSSLIIRIPDDPINPGHQIWTYYTHMASPEGESFIVSDFPPGTQEVYVEAGTLLGYQGNYSGTPGNPVGVHLHFSIVKDDGQGRFKNELEIENTLDPSPYFGLQLNAGHNTGEVPSCED